MKIYDYLEELYNSNEQFKDIYNDLDDFMDSWLRDNFASDALYEEFLNDDFIRYHYRSFEIDHNARTISFSLTDGEW